MSDINIFRLDFYTEHWSYKIDYSILITFYIVLLDNYSNKSIVMGKMADLIQLMLKENYEHY